MNGSAQLGFSKRKLSALLRAPRYPRALRREGLLLFQDILAVFLLAMFARSASASDCAAIYFGRVGSSDYMLCVQNEQNKNRDKLLQTPGHTTEDLNEEIKREAERQQQLRNENMQRGMCKGMACRDGCDRAVGDEDNRCRRTFPPASDSESYRTCLENARSIWKQCQGQCNDECDGYYEN